jgi:phage FluMu gp28-like protein
MAKQPAPKRKPKAAPKPAPRIGRPSQFGDDTIAAARERYLLGDSPADIARDIGCSRATVQRWIRDGNWRKELRDRRNTLGQLDAEIARIAKDAAKGANPLKLAMLTKARDRVSKATPKPKPRPSVRAAVHADLLNEVLKTEYGLYDYQREFLESDARYRCILKARQIGFSYIIGLAVVLGAMAGRTQLIVSASKMQSDIVLGHALKHIERLGLTPDEKPSADCIKLNGAQILSLPANFRTIQGQAGDLWLDEFAWHIKPKRIWDAVLPSITQVGGRVTVCSTPFVPGNWFWNIAENYQGRWDHFERTRITIHDAIAQGMPCPGGIDELKLNFDLDAWAMFYECQWAEDGSALLSWELLQDLAVPDISLYRVGRLRAGVDVGRIHDRTSIALTGEVMDQVANSYLGKYALTHWESHKNMPFAQQDALIRDLDTRWSIDEWLIDRTIIGWQMAEGLQKDLHPRVTPIWFSAQEKDRLANNLRLLAERRELILPNDPVLLAGLHSVKKIASGNTLKFDAERTSEGHGDEFWATALSVRDRAPRGGGGCEMRLF